MAAIRLPVTGMAWTTPLGDDLDEVFDRLLAGHTGIAPVPHAVRLRNALAASVGSMPSGLPAGERLRRMAHSTIAQALAAAGRDPADRGVRLILGTSLGAYLEEAAERNSLYEWAREVGDRVGVSSPPIAVSTACSSGS